MKSTMTLTIAAAALAALVCAGPLQAHHTGAVYQATPIWVKGTVVRFEGVNPHTITTLEERGDEGQVRRWAVEGPGQFQLGRLGLVEDTPKVGDVIEFCAFPYKSVEELSRMYPGVDFASRRRTMDADGTPLQSVAGNVMVMPDGAKRFWEPHGVLSECIRSSDDRRRSWLDFLDSNARARQAWCEQRGYALVQSNASLKRFVEEIDGLIDNPCP